MPKKLPARPNLDHLRRQSKVLLAGLNARESDAARAFIEHLPEATKLTAGVGRRPTPLPHGRRRRAEARLLRRSARAGADAQPVA